MRKYWSPFCSLHLRFTKNDLRRIEQEYNILIIPSLYEPIAESMFLHNYRKIGFDKVTSDRSCMPLIWDRLGQNVDFKGVDYIAWKNGIPYTLEVETWASFVRFHSYQAFLDYIICFQKDNYQYGNTKVIELTSVVGIKEIITQSELESFLYENSEQFRNSYDQTIRLSYARKMGIDTSKLLQKRV